MLKCSEERAGKCLDDTEVYRGRVMDDFELRNLGVIEAKGVHP